MAIRDDSGLATKSDILLLEQKLVSLIVDLSKNTEQWKNDIIGSNEQWKNDIIGSNEQWKNEIVGSNEQWKNEIVGSNEQWKNDMRLDMQKWKEEMYGWKKEMQADMQKWKEETVREFHISFENFRIDLDGAYGDMLSWVLDVQKGHSRRLRTIEEKIVLLDE